MKAFKLRHRVTRTRVKVGKLPEFERLQRPLWIRRVLVRAQEGQLKALQRISLWSFSVFQPPLVCEFLIHRCHPFVSANRIVGFSTTCVIVSGSARR